MTFFVSRFRHGLRALMLSACVGLLCAAAQAQVYGLKQSAPLGSATVAPPDTVLFTITPDTWPVTGPSTIAATVPVMLGGAAVSADGLAINGNNELFAYVNDGNIDVPGDATARLVSLNKTTGVATLVGSVVLQDVRVSGAAFDMQGRLWIMTYDQIAGTGTTRLQQINPATGATIGAAITVTAVSPSGDFDIAFDLNNNAYVSGQASLFSLNMTTGAATAIQTFPNTITSDGVSIPGFDGLAIYHNGEVWMTQGRMGDRVFYGPAVDAPVGDFFNTVLDLTTDTGTLNSGKIDLAARPNRVTAANDSASTPPNTPVNINILGNDKDVWNPPGVNLDVDDSAILPISTWGKNTANGGTVTLNPNGTVTYTPAPGFTGTDTFTYRVLADDGSWAEATVTVYVGVMSAGAAAVPTLDSTALALLALAVLGLAVHARRRRV